MKNNNKFRLDVWGFITLAMIALYLVFMIYPMGYLIRQSVWDAETGAFTWANFAKFFSKSYYSVSYTHLGVYYAAGGRHAVDCR